MIGSTEQVSDELEALRRQDFDDFCQAFEADHEREQDIAEPEQPWLYEKEPMSPRLTAMVLDLKIKFDSILQRRRYRHSREWL